MKTRTGRRSINRDPATETVLAAWRAGQGRDGHPVGLPERCSLTSPGGRCTPSRSANLSIGTSPAPTPRIRFHDLRHTHASLLVAAGTPIKVVSERLGHAHPGFTIATFQHLIPGMSAHGRYSTSPTLIATA